MNSSAPTGFALVVGGTGAIGAASAHELAGLPLSIAFTYHSNHAKADEIAAELRAREVGVLADSVDGTDYAAVTGFIDSATAELGPMKALVYAASPHVSQIFLSKIEPEHFRSQLTQDASVFFNFVHASLPHLRAARGAIVAVTTVATRRFPVMDGLSSVPKGAVESLIRALAAEEGRYGVRANAVGPGILSDGVGHRLIESGEFTPAGQAAVLQRTPMGRFGRASEVAKAVRFLASEEASFITGQKLDVDGGYGG